MKNVIKLIKQFISFVLLSIKRALDFIVKNIKKFIGWYKYNFKYNRSKLVFSTVVSIFLICVITISVFKSYAKFGYNVNPLYGETIGETPWYRKLSNIDTSDKLDYVSYDGTVATSFAGGTGTAEDPFQIATPSQLLYLRKTIDATNPSDPDYRVKSIRNAGYYTAYRIPGTVDSYGYVINNMSYRNDGPDGGTYYTRASLRNETGVTFTKVRITANVENSSDHLLNVVYGMWDIDLSSDYNVDDTTHILTYEKTINLAPNSEIFTEIRSSGSFVSDYKVIFIDNENHEYIPKEDLEEFEAYDPGEEYTPATIAPSNRHYIVTNNLDLSGIEFGKYQGEGENRYILTIGNNTNSFSGIFDGNFKTLKNLEIDSNVSYAGLFGYVTGTVKNVTLRNVNAKFNTSTTEHGGALVAYATANAKIYNNGILNGKVSVEGNSNSKIGSLVGHIAGTAVVTNSYSAANITSTSSGDHVTLGGIVGYREATNSQQLELNNPIVYLLVYYGTITVPNSTNYQFVYNGEMVHATNTPTYCYYKFTNDVKDVITAGNQEKDHNTYAILKTEEELKSDGFKAHLNTYRFAADYYVNVRNGNDFKHNEANGYSDIAKWVIDANYTDFVSLKKYDPVSNEKYFQFAETKEEAIDRFGEGNFLKVNFKNNGESTSRTVPLYLKITGKDEASNDFVNRKVVLPFNSVSTKFKYNDQNRDSVHNIDMTISGWQLTSVTYNRVEFKKNASGLDFEYNYVLRKGKNGATKDIGALYAQGGYYLIPEGVTEVTFSTKWARVFYVGGSTNEEVLQFDYNKDDNKSLNYGTITTDSAQTCGRTIDNPCSSIGAAYTSVQAMSWAATKFDINEIVFILTNNVFEHGRSNSDNTTLGNIDQITTKWPFSTWDENYHDAVTIKSLDRDNDLEPDYAIYYRSRGETNMVEGVRFDFVNLLGMPQVGTVASSLGNFSFPQNKVFEITETAITDQITLKIAKANRVKVNGGWVNIIGSADQLTFKNDDYANNLPYIYFGGNAIADYVNFGSASSETGNGSNIKFPVFVVAGGRIKNLSSTYINTQINASNKVRFFIDGGYIDKMYLTYNSSLLSGAKAIINNSYINHYYAGGHTSSSSISKGVYTEINNSVMGEVYGGPEYGSVTGGSTLNVYKSTVKFLYGGGYGGTETVDVGESYFDLNVAGERGNCSDTYSISAKNSSSPLNTNRVITHNNQLTIPDKTYLLGRKSNTYGIETGYTATLFTWNKCTLSTFASQYSNLSVASVDRVKVNFVESELLSEFYGGGNKGVVTGDVEVNIKKSTINGDVYGGGYSNATETIDVIPNYDTLLSNPNLPKPVFISYNVDSQANYPTRKTYTWTSDKSKFTDIMKETDIHEDDIIVHPNAPFIYTANAGILGKIGGNIYLNIFDSTLTGSIYGGGNLSVVENDIHVNLYGKNKMTDKNAKVFGGGNHASVKNTDIRLLGGEYNEAYAGGNEGAVTGTATITATDNAKATSIYGGGMNSSANMTHIYLVNGVYTNVFGGSNLNGDVTTTGINIGVLNDNPLLFDAEPFPPITGVDNSLVEGQVINSSEYLPDIDPCLKHDVGISYVFDPGTYKPFKFSVTNNTTYAFHHFIVEFKLKDSSLTLGFADGKGTFITNSNGEIKFPSTFDDWSYNQNNPRYDPLPPNETYTWEFVVNPKQNVVLESVEVTVYDENNHEVTSYSGSCKMPEVVVDPNYEEEEETDVRFTFERPTTATEAGVIEIENLFGGNNEGGSVDHTNLVIDYGKVTIDNLYGGGNKAYTRTTNVVVRSGTVYNVFGGGKNGQTGDRLINKDIPTTKVSIENADIEGNVYGAGDGSDAKNFGSSVVYIKGTSHIKGSVFAGGNEAVNGEGIIKDGPNGSKETEITVSANAKVYVTGGTVEGDVFGGPDRSQVYGHTDVVIGDPENTDPDSSYVVIKGSVYGGGHTNEEGAPGVDFSFISVAEGTYVKIIETEKTPITIKKNIMGSGASAVTKGVSNVYIKDFGKYNKSDNTYDLKTILSIQRASNVYIDNSNIYVIGTTDSTNDFNDKLFSISRSQRVVISNNSTLFLGSNTNRVEELTSGILAEDDTVTYETIKYTTRGDGVETPFEYLVDNKDGLNEYDINVDNRIYMAPSIAVNLASIEKIDTIDINDIASFGKVYGMAFLGLFAGDSADTIKTGYFDKNVLTGSQATIEDTFLFDAGSYVKGAHKQSHNITVDGYFTNYVDPETRNITTKVIVPTPAQLNYYQWNVGVQSNVYRVDLIASKFTALGTTSFALTDYYRPNTKFTFDGYTNNSLTSGVKLMPCDLIPKVAATDEDALNNFGLRVETSITGWITNRSMEFYSPDRVPNYSGGGDGIFISDNSNAAPTFNFYLIHSQNIFQDKNLGFVLIKFLVTEKIDALTEDVSEIYFKVVMTTKFFDTVGYDGNMTPGKEYELFTTKKTVITSTSSLSAYYSLYVKDVENDEKKRLVSTDRRVLASSFVLPVNTRITLVDRTNSDNPTYYSYVVKEGVEPEVMSHTTADIEHPTNIPFYLYSLSDFVKMGSITDGNNFSDELANINNYDDDTHVSSEEFIFVVDFSESNITTDLKNKELFVMTLNSDGEEKFGPIDNTRLNLVYDIYNDMDASIDVTLDSDKDTAYVGSNFNITSDLKLNQKVIEIEGEGKTTVYDTNYIQDRMGIKITLFDSTGQVSGTTLLGTIFYVDGVAYSADLDGSIRMPVSDSVANVIKNIKVDLTKSLIPTGTYTMVIEAFGSPDGLYYGLTSTGRAEIQIKINNELYGLNIEIPEEDIIIDSETGKNLNNTNIIDFNVKYTSQYNEPSLKFRLLRRKYSDTEFIDENRNKVSLEYEEVDLATVASDSYSKTIPTEYLYDFIDNPLDNNSLKLTMKDNIPTGTYKLVVEFYSEGVFIGQDYEYIFIK